MSHAILNMEKAVNSVATGMVPRISYAN